MVGAAAGLIAGMLIRKVASRLPTTLFQQWAKEACDLLGIDDREDLRPITTFKRQVHIFQRHLVPELASAVLSAIVVAKFGLSAQAVAMLVLTWGLLIVVLIDSEYQIIPDLVVLPLLWLGLIANALGFVTTLDDALYGAVAGYLTLWIVLHGFQALAGREGMGHGDLKMLAMLGAWGGWQQLLLIIVLSSSTAAIYGIGAKGLSRFKGQELPFGPFLGIAGFVAIIWGDTLSRYYVDYSM
nr:A24 family peptidase [Pseudomonas fluorescens]